MSPSPGQTDEWSAPDAQGIRTLVLDKRREKRLRRSDSLDLHAIEVWPQDWKTLTSDWLRAKGDRSLRKQLSAAATNRREHLVPVVAEALLEAGWIEIEEHFKSGGWRLYRLAWLDADRLREVLGLPRRDVSAQVRAEALAAKPGDERLAPLHASLAGKPLKTVLARSGLLLRLDTWLAEERSGTRQHFAHFARGDTKAISRGEWDWLGGHADLDGMGISRHPPAFSLRAPFSLIAATGRLDLAIVPDLIRLSPDTLRSLERIESHAGRWLLIENHANFEDVARRLGHRDAVVWLPGFAPDWWLEVMARLVSLHPAPAFIAADPDPAGIDIALRAGQVWGNHWTPWAMSEEALAQTGHGKPLNTFDRERLEALAKVDLPTPLRALADALERGGRKGEQEALDLTAWLD